MVAILARGYSGNLVALDFGALLYGLNPKNPVFTIAAARGIAQAQLATGQALVPAVIDIALASVS